MVNTKDVDGFVRFACELNPGFDSSIRGADWRQVDELERKARTALPEAFRQLLLRMGQDDGGLCLAFEESLDIDGIIAYYRQVAEEQPETLPCPPGYIVLAPRGDEPNICVAAIGEAPLVFAVGGRIIRAYSDSLVSLLHRDAFIAFGIIRHPHRAFAAGREGDFDRSVLAQAVGLAERLGYRQEWYSDSVVACGRSPRGGMMAITQYEGGPLGVNVGAKSRREVLGVAWEFRREYGLELVESS